MGTLATPTYHLWLKPSGRPYDVLAATIHELARELDVAPFEPHVTLLAYLDGTEAEHRRKTAELASRLTPFDCLLTEPAFLDEHFRCLFMLVDPGAAIMACHTSAARAFNKPAEAYMPHVSLVYGSFSESRKKAIIARLSPEVRTSFVVQSVILLKSESMEPKDWHEIAEYPFGARAFAP
jgi:2'-5' RNA ligase